MGFAEVGLRALGFGLRLAGTRTAATLVLPTPTDPKPEAQSLKPVYACSIHSASACSSSLITTASRLPRSAS